MVAIDVVDGNVFLNDSQVTSTDIEASNGVVHVIDKVLVPGIQDAASNETSEESKSIAEIAVAGGFNTLVAALSAADLVETFREMVLQYLHQLTMLSLLYLKEC